MKHLKTYESIRDNGISYNIRYLADKLSSSSSASFRLEAVNYIKKVIDYYKMTDDEVFNLSIAVESRYLDFDIFKTVVSEINKSEQDDIYIYHLIERKFKIAYKSNYRKKIIKHNKPYIICTRFKSNITDNDDINGFNFDEIIGEIPAEYPFGKKYVIGEGRYRGDSNNDKTLWEKYRNTNRYYEFIKIVDADSKHLFILTETEIEEIKMRGIAKKYNI